MKDFSPKMKNAFIILTRTGSRFSRFLALFTKAEYNHASICIHDDFREFYSFGRHIIHFPLISGFVVERINCGMYKFFSETRCVIYRLQVNEGTFIKLEGILDEFRTNPDNYKYNFLGLLGVFLNKPMGKKDHYFCSQFVASVVEECGIHNFSKSSMLVTPEDFYTVPGIQKIYEGRLSDLPHTEIVMPEHTLIKVATV